MVIARRRMMITTVQMYGFSMNIPKKSPKNGAKFENNFGHTKIEWFTMGDFLYGQKCL